MNLETLRCFSELMKTDVVWENADGKLTACFECVEDSPLMQDSDLRRILRDACSAQGSPYYYIENHRICFTAYACQEGFLYLGPMCGSRLSLFQRSNFLESHGVNPDSTRSLRAFTMRQIELLSQLMETLTHIDRAPVKVPVLCPPMDVTNEQMLHLEQNVYISQEEAARDEDSYRHSYQEEEQILLAVQEGRTQDAIRLSEKLDADSGTFSRTDILHWRSMAIISITLVARAAISAGVSPAVAYRNSGYFISKCNAASDVGSILYYRNQNIVDCCERVRTVNSTKQFSPYTRKCMDYIQKHFREKIQVHQIADPMGISPDYLARQFKKDTGILIQEYVNQQRVNRAAELLIYSNHTLSAIAEYVHFPSQSYFGRVFRQFKGMTPSDYRKRYQLSEFWES